MFNKIVKTINTGRIIKPTITPRARERSSNVIATSTLSYSKKTPRRVKKRNYCNSFILGHTTLGRLRTDRNFEADCSDNGNHGTWYGSDIDGDQYAAPYFINYTSYYDFDGDADDRRGDNDGTVIGADLTTDENGTSDSAYDFTTSGDYIDFGTDSSFDNIFDGGGLLAIKAYIRSDGQDPSTAVMISKHQASADNGWYILTDSETATTIRIRFVQQFSGTDYEARFNVNKNEWSTIIINYDNSSTTNEALVQVNGSVISPTHITPSGTRSDDTGNNLIFGNETGYGKTFDGVVETLFLSSTSFTSSQMEKIYSEGLFAKDGQRLSAGKFNGTDVVVQGPATNTVISDNTSFTIYGTFIANTVSSASQRVFTFRIGTGSTGIYLYTINSTQMRLRYRDTLSVWQVFDFDVDEGAMYNFMFVSDNGTETFYVNESSSSQTNGVYPLGDATMAVGGYKDGTSTGGDFFDGIIDEFMVFDVPCTADDYSDFRNNKFYSNHSKYGNCVLWWSFDDPLLGDRRTPLVLIEETDN